MPEAVEEVQSDGHTCDVALRKIVTRALADVPKDRAHYNNLTLNSDFMYRKQSQVLTKSGSESLVNWPARSTAS